MNLSERQKKIYQLIASQQSIGIQEIGDHFSISIMTVHRDINRLVSAGLIQKGHGVVSLIEQVVDRQHCSICGGYISERTKFILNRMNGEQLLACCIHCGLILLNTTDQIVSTMVPDFIYGTMVSVHDCTFVVGSTVKLCCTPTILGFGSRVDAEYFIKGFGGSLSDFNGIRGFAQQSIEK
jgi:DeoR/GlpR family transcriptional regulator of sugar metabolism